MSLFQTGDFTLHSKGKTDFRIDCDALTDEDLAALALIASRLVSPFSEIYGVPRGGIAMAAAMRKYLQPPSGRTAGLLIVDDVLTTGTSMREARKRFWPHQPYASLSVPVQGLVIFSRDPANCPDWVKSVFCVGSFCSSSY